MNDKEEGKIRRTGINMRLLDWARHVSTSTDINLFFHSFSLAHHHSLENRILYVGDIFTFIFSVTVVTCNENE